MAHRVAAAGVVMLVAVVADRLALVVYLVSTIVALRKITAGPRRDHRRGRRDRREDRARSTTVVDDDQPAPRRRRRRARGPAGEEGRDGGRGRPGRRPLPRRGRRGLPRLRGERATITAPRIGEVYTRGTLTLARLGREAPIAAAARRPGAAQRRPAAAWRRARCTRRPPARQDPAGLAGDRCRRAGAVRAGRRQRRPRQRLPATCRRRDAVQTPAPFEYERATSVEGAIAALGRLGPDARIIAGGHSLLPMMKLRLAKPAHLIDINDLDELAYIREEGDEIRDRRDDPPRRPARSPSCSRSASRCSATPSRSSPTRWCATAARSAARSARPTRPRTCPRSARRSRRAW